MSDFTAKSNETAPADEGQMGRRFNLGFVIGVVINLLLACGLFLSVEDNRQLLLTGMGDAVVRFLGTNLVIFAVAAVATRKPFRGFAAGFGAAALIVMAVDAFFMFANYPIPSQAEMCSTARAFQALAEEGLEIEAGTPVESARDYYGRVGTAYREEYDTLVLIGNITPTYAALGPLQQSIEAVEGRATVGPAAADIRAKVRELVNALRWLVMEAC